MFHRVKGGPGGGLWGFFPPKKSCSGEAVGKYVYYSVHVMRFETTC